VVVPAAQAAPASPVAGADRPKRASTQRGGRAAPDPMYAKARSLYDAGDWPGLLEHTTAWTGQQPDRQFAWMYLGLAHERLGHRELALDANLRAHALDPGHVQIGINLANTRIDLGQLREAAVVLEGVLQRAPDSSRALNDYGFAMSKLGEYDEAVAALEHAIEVDPGYTRAWKNLSDAYQRAGYLDKANEVTRRANAR
jgi:tetratricopeptide (TPR) repeat protein